MKRVAVVAAVALLASVLVAGELPASAEISVGVDEPPAGQWLAGDLHVHTTYSHDSYGGPGDSNTDPLEDPPGSFSDLITAGHPVTSQFAVAASRGLDYVAITDHNDVRSQSDPGWQFAKDIGVIPVPGYENSLSGHAQMIGATKLYDNGDKSVAAVNALADQLRADGGVFQANHPTDGDGRYPDNMGWTYGFDVAPDTIEVWNITRAWQKPAPSSNSADDATLYWQEWLDKGHRVAATGGSDTHWVTTTAAQGVGQPTTWVYATENSAQGILEGLRDGRTFISHQPPNYGGAQIFLEADSNRDGSYESMVGDTVPTGAPLRARVVGAPGSLLRVYTDGGAEAFAPVPVTSASFTHEFTLPSGTWVRAEAYEPDAQAQRRDLCDQPLGDDTTYCRNQIGVIAMTSALYLSGGVDPSPTPTPTDDPEGTTYESGETYARVSDDRLLIGNGLVERTWDLDSFGTTSITDLRAGGKPWGGASSDFTLDLGPHKLASEDFTATATTVDEIAGPGLRVKVDLTSPGLDATRVIDIYEGVAGFKTRTILHPTAPLPLFGYTLDSMAAGSSVKPTIHALRAGADWRDPINGWDGPEKPHEQWPLPTSVGDPHGGTWRESRTAAPGQDLEGPAQWISLADGDRSAFMVMERNDNPSSRAGFTSETAHLEVDLSRDVIILGPLEETAHVENPTDAPARHRLLKPGQSLKLEPAFLGFGEHDGDEAWQFHKYLVEHRLTPYAHDVTFNSNGTDDDVISTGAKDDMSYAIVEQVAPKARSLGVDTFILDDGWQAISGDWYPDCPDHREPRSASDPVKYAPRFPDCEFRAVRDAIAPMKLGLWMSPMHFNPNSVTYRSHPEWACAPVGQATAVANAADPESGSNEAGIGTWGPDAIPHIEGRIREAIESWEVSYFKFDFLVWLDCVGQGDMYDYREAFISMLDRLRADHPDVTFEIDETNDYRLFPFESVTRGPSWFQNGNPGPRHLLHNLWNLSPFIPTFSLGQGFLGNTSARREHGVDTIMAAALLSHLTYFSDLREVAQADIDAARPWIDFYKANKDALGHAVYPLLEDPLEDRWTALQSWNPEAGEGALLAFRQEDASPTTTVRLENVPDNMTFDLFRAPTNKHIGTVTSAELTSGYTITLPSKRTAEVIVIRPVSDDPGPIQTNLAFTDASAENGQYSDDVRLEAKLTTDDGQPIAGQNVTFDLVGADTRTYSASTDGAGVATVTVTSDSAPGPYRLSASYAGFEGELQPASTSMDFEVFKEDTDLALTTSGKGSKRSLVATLTDRDSNVGVSGRSLEFFADGNLVCVITTDSNGVAVCSLPPRYAGGHHDYVADFKGDAFYRPTSGSAAQ